VVPVEKGRVEANCEPEEKGGSDQHTGPTVSAQPLRPQGIHGDRLIRKDEERGLGVAQMEEASLEMLNHLMKLEDDIFGEESVGEWFMVSNVRHGNVLVLVDLKTHRSIGIAILMRDWADIQRCYLSDFGVKAGYRGRGLGSYFLGVVLEEVRLMGIHQVSLTVDVNNSAAMGLYRKFGFSIAEERTNLYGEGRDRYVMELEL
jgi:ribosomal-protein-alanine N-acetyltransferase